MRPLRTIWLISLAILLPQPVTAQAPAALARDSAVVGIERAIWDHVAAGRWEGVQSILDGVFTVGPGGIYTWRQADTERLRARFTACRLTGFTLRDAQTREVTTDVVVLGYAVDLSLECAAATQTMTNRYVSTYRRRGAGWELVASGIIPEARPQ